ncbi:MAG: hypothetical protein ACN6RD_14955, partial [Stenotrophomonas maltophilia]
QQEVSLGCSDALFHGRRPGNRAAFFCGRASTVRHCRPYLARAPLERHDEASFFNPRERI